MPPPIPEAVCWVRPEEIAGLADGDPIDPWPAAPDSLGGMSATSASPPLKATVNGQVCGVFARGALIGSVQLLTPDHSPMPQGDMTIFIVSNRVSVLAPSGPVLGLVTFASMRGHPMVRDADVAVDLRSPAFTWPSSTPPDRWEYWTIWRSGTEARLYWRGVQVAEGDPASVAALSWQLFAWSNSLLANRSAAIAELVILPYAASAEALVDWFAYLEDRYPW